jgi:hypothetical protein
MGSGPTMGFAWFGEAPTFFWGITKLLLGVYRA